MEIAFLISGAKDVGPDNLICLVTLVYSLRTSWKPWHGVSSGLNENTDLLVVLSSPKPYAGISLSSSNTSKVLPTISITS